MYIYRLAHALGNEGHHVDVVHDIDAYHLQHPAEPEIYYQEHPRVDRHGVTSGYGWLSPLLTQQTGRAFLKRKEIDNLLSSRSYDVIQYHNISLLGPEIMSLSPPNSDPIKLYMTHEHWLICPTHVLWKFNRRACEKPQCLPCILLAKRPPQLWRYTGYLEVMARNVDRFVSPSKFSANFHRQRGFPFPVEHLPYFIERSDSDWSSPGARPQDRPYFLFVGRIEKIKGVHTLLEVWQEKRNYDLLIAGTGTELEKLRKQAAGNPQVKFLGHIQQRELGNLYVHALATLVPSLTYETFGFIVIESFARKTPVIVRDLGPLPELVEESKGGFIYKDREGLQKYLDIMAAQPIRRDELGEAGYAAFLRNWTREAHMVLYYDMINSLAEEKFGVIPWC
jgi:glycosyltransferase involved in cell wall biosynthesis